MPPLQGLFGLAKRLFDVDIEPADGQVPVWQEDVRFFCVKKVGWATGGQPFSCRCSALGASTAKLLGRCPSASLTPPPCSRFLVQAGQPKAYFYLDPYSRPAEKRGGAW